MGCSPAAIKQACCAEDKGARANGYGAPRLFRGLSHKGEKRLIPHLLARAIAPGDNECVERGKIIRPEVSESAVCLKRETACRLNGAALFRDKFDPIGALPILLKRRRKELNRPRNIEQLRAVIGEHHDMAWRGELLGFIGGWL